MSSIYVIASPHTRSNTAGRLCQRYPAQHGPAAEMPLPPEQHGDDQHAADVAWLAGRLCAKLRVPDVLARRVVNGARTHDIGKTLVPHELLARAGPLNAEEREQVKLHALRGALLLQKRAVHLRLDLSIEISVALSHHERWNGNGYPYGLAGAEIPLAARIVAVADVYDALITARGYKTAWPHKLALEAIHDGRGTHFDPECADALIYLARSLPANWTRSAQRAHERTKAASTTVVMPSVDESGLLAATRLETTHLLEQIDGVQDASIHATDSTQVARWVAPALAFPPRCRSMHRRLC